MSKPYLSIPLAQRLKAFKLNGKTKLGHGWHEPPYDTTKDRAANSKCKWCWVPDTVIETGLVNGESHHGCWSGPSWKPAGMSTELRVCDNLTGYFRNVTEADELVRLNHKGWYVDSNYDETTKGIVVQLPARDGKPVYLHGCTDPWNANMALIAWRECEWTEDKEEAARWADSVAESYAEMLREDHAKEEAKHEIEQARERIEEIRITTRLLTREIKDVKRLNPKTKQAVSPFTPAICDALKIRIRHLRSESHELWERITKLEDNYWEAVSH